MHIWTYCGYSRPFWSWIQAVQLPFVNRVQSMDPSMKSVVPGTLQHQVKVAHTELGLAGSWKHKSPSRSHGIALPTFLGCLCCYSSISPSTHTQGPMGPAPGPTEHHKRKMKEAGVKKWITEVSHLFLVGLMDNREERQSSRWHQFEEKISASAQPANQDGQSFLV